MSLPWWKNSSTGGLTTLEARPDDPRAPFQIIGSARTARAVCAPRKWKVTQIDLALEWGWLWGEASPGRLAIGGMTAAW